MTSLTTRPSPEVAALSVALDNSVLDHLHRVQAGTYAGAHAEPLRRIRAAAESRRILVWISEVTSVEMLHGIEKIASNDLKRSNAAARDQEKSAIAAAMGARTLGYPCSKLGDTYSRLGMSFRLAGPDSHLADTLERTLLSIPGVSPGDARQLVSCAFPFDGAQVEHHPQLHWFVAEDTALIRALTQEIVAGHLPELRQLAVGSAADLVAAHTEVF